MKRIILLVSAVLLLTACIPLPAFAAGTATVSVEAFTVGGGYIVPPTSVAPGCRASEILLRALAENGYTAFYGGAPDSAFYLAYVADGDKTGSYNGYRCASAVYPVRQPKHLTFTTAISAPLKAYLNTHAGYFDESDYETNSPGYLGEFVYTDLSGWMYSLNGDYTQKDLSSVYLKAGDTLRLQFTLCLGADVGGAEPALQQAFDAEMGRTPTAATTQPTTKAPPATTKPAPSTTKAPQTTKPAPTTARAPQTTARAAQTTAAAQTTSAVNAVSEEPSATLPTAATAAPAGTTSPTAAVSSSDATQVYSIPEPSTELYTQTAAYTYATEPAQTGVSENGAAAGGKKASIKRILVISAAAAVPVTALAVVIIVKKLKETI